MDKIINGNILAEKIKNQIVKDIVGANEVALLDLPRPNLALVLIGERPDSQLYVSLKEREAKKVGIDTHIYRIAEDTPEQEVLELIDFLNTDNLIDAILVQLPLPAHLDTDKIIARVSPEKDVDGFHPENLKKIGTTDTGFIMPPVFGVVFEILKNINCDIKDKTFSILANSAIFGNNLAQLINNAGGQANVVSPDDPELKTKTVLADVLITAIGQPKFITKEMIKKDAIVIDIGISKIADKIYGDVDFENALEQVSHITPVPGGVGPLTIAMALQNTLKLYQTKHK